MRFVSDRLASLPRPVTHAAAATLGGSLLVIGGRGAAPNSQTRAILAVSPTGAVSPAGTLPRPLSDLAAIQAHEALVLAGGRDQAGNPQSAIFTISLSR